MVVHVLPLLVREDHREAHRQPGEKRKRDGSLRRRGPLAHRVHGVDDGDVALRRGHGERGEEQDVEHGVHGELSHRRGHPPQQVHRHRDNRKDGVHDAHADEKLKVGELLVPASLRAALFQGHLIRTGEAVALAQHRGERGD